MKNKITHLSYLLLLCLILQPLAVFAQGTAFTYQGSLNDGTNRANGTYDLKFALYDAASGNGLIANAVTNPATSVANGLFTVALDFGAGVFTGAPRWLEISVRSNGVVSFSLLTPRQALTATPYAITASNLTGNLPASQLSGALSSVQLSGSYNSPVNFNNAADQFSGTFFGAFSGSTFTGGNFIGHFIGDGSGLTSINASSIGGIAPTNLWLTTGNSNILAGFNYIGTADSNAFELRANNDRGLRIEPDPRNAHVPNLIGGYGGNSILPPLSGGNTIAGGGYPGGPNIISSNSAGDFIGAGSVNLIGPSVFDSVIAGGQNNANLMSDSVIGGGTGNLVNTNMSIFGYQPYYSVIGGGQNNSAEAAWGVIAGGYFNTNSGLVSFVGAGDFNSTHGRYSALAGGYFNEAGGDGSFVGGGGLDNIYTIGNRADGDGSVVVGGVGNVIYPQATDAAILGGLQNSILSNSFASTIVGGFVNTIQTNSYYSFIGGGDQNVIATSAGFIGGGENNSIGLFSYDAAIGGGVNNRISSNAFSSTINGGNNNSISNNAVYATIGGGSGNAAGDIYSIVPGGYQNVALGSYTFAAGRQAKALNFGSFVWADSQGIDFASTAPNQFLIRANGGVGINKNNPTTALDVFGTVTAFNFSGSGGGLTGLNAGQFSTGTLPSAALSGVYSSALNFNNVGNSFTGNGSGLANVNASLLGGFSSSGFWSTTGNAGTSPGANYIGTSDNKNLLIKGAFVGIGRTFPISGADAFAVECPATAGNFGGMYLNTTGTGALPFYGYSIANSVVAFHYVDGADANKWKLTVGGGVRLTVTTAGNVGIGNTAPTNLLMVVNARCDGSTWINASDRNLKENFAPIDPGQILSKVAALPLNQWNYKHDASAHLGPVAQDFYAQFNLGADDKTIATVDESGVALAAIQGLNNKVEAQAAQLEEKDSRIAALEKAVAELRTLVTQRPAR